MGDDSLMQSSIRPYIQEQSRMVATFKTLICSFFLLLATGNIFIYSFVTSSESSRKIARKMTDNDSSSEQKIPRKTWNPLRLAVLRLGLTEPMMTSPFNYGDYKDGTFKCAYCDHQLFDGSTKYDSKSGWPSFWRTKQDGALSYRMEGDGRLECKCKRCNSHLGHVFLDGPKPNSVDSNLLKTSPESDPRSRSGAYLPRFCINGAAMRYEKNQQ